MQYNMIPDHTWHVSKRRRLFLHILLDLLRSLWKSSAEGQRCRSNDREKMTSHRHKVINLLLELFQLVLLGLIRLEQGRFLCAEVLPLVLKPE